MHMPEEDPEVFDNFVNWLYRDKLCHNELANPVMDNIQDIHLKDRSVFATPTLQEFYSKTRENSKIRQYGTLSNLWDTLAATKVQGDVPDLIQLGKDFPDFAGDFMELFSNHGWRFSVGNKPDPRRRCDKEGFASSTSISKAKNVIWTYPKSRSKDEDFSRDKFIVSKKCEALIGLHRIFGIQKHFVN